MGIINLNQILVGPGDTSDVEACGDILLGLNKRVRHSVNKAVTATGTAASGAVQLTAVHNVCTSVAVHNNSVIFDATQAGEERRVTNFGASTLSVWPATGGSINNLAGVTLNSGLSASFLAVDDNRFVQVKTA